MNKTIGRPRKDPKHARIMMGIRVHPKTQKTLKREAKRNGLSQGEMIDMLVRDHLEDHNKYVTEADFA